MPNYRRTPLHVIFSGIALAISLAITAQAAIITYVGVDETTGGNWRTTTTSKPLDIDGDNVYGTFGYYNWATGSTGVFNGADYSAPNTLNGLTGDLSLAPVGTTDRASYSANYPLFDDPTVAPGPSVTDIRSGLAWRQVPSGIENSFAHGAFIDVFMATTIAETLRIGLIHNGGGERVTGVAMQEPGSGSFTPETGLDTLAPQQFRYFFFDVSGVTAGDVYRIFLRGENSNTGNTSNNYGLAGLSFDLAPAAAPVPEPSTLGLLALCFGGLGWFAIRRRKAS